MSLQPCSLLSIFADFTLRHQTPSRKLDGGWTNPFERYQLDLPPKPQDASSKWVSGEDQGENTTKLWVPTTPNISCICLYMYKLHLVDYHLLFCILTYATMILYVYRFIKINILVVCLVWLWFIISYLKEIHLKPPPKHPIVDGRNPAPPGISQTL